MHVELVSLWVDLSPDGKEKSFEGSETPCCHVEGDIHKVYHCLRRWDTEDIVHSWVSTYLICRRCAKSYDAQDNQLFEFQDVDKPKTRLSK